MANGDSSRFLSERADVDRLLYASVFSNGNHKLGSFFVGASVVVD